MTPSVSITVLLHKIPKQLSLNIRHAAKEQDTVQRVQRVQLLKNNSEMVQR